MSNFRYRDELLHALRGHSLAAAHPTRQHQACPMYHNHIGAIERF